MKSALLSIKGENLDDFKNKWEISEKWVGESHLRPGHKRKNWFIGISFIIPYQNFKWLEKDFRIDTMRASGPGGQYANKTSSRVRG